VLLHLHKSMTEVDRGELNNYLGVQLGVFGVLKLGASPPPPPPTQQCQEQLPLHTHPFLDQRQSLPFSFYFDQQRNVVI